MAICRLQSFSSLSWLFFFTFSASMQENKAHATCTIDNENFFSIYRASCVCYRLPALPLNQKDKMHTELPAPNLCSSLYFSLISSNCIICDVLALEPSQQDFLQNAVMNTVSWSSNQLMCEHIVTVIGIVVIITWLSLSSSLSLSHLTALLLENRRLISHWKQEMS